MPEAEIGWIAAMIVGGLAGWFAEMFMKSGTGIFMNILLGILGAALANWLLGLFGVALGGWLGYLCRFTLQCGTHVLLDFNRLGETEVSLEAFEVGLPQAF